MSLLSPSLLPLWIKDLDPQNMSEANLENWTRAKSLKTTDRPAWAKLMEGLGTIAPESVHKKTFRRTDLQITLNGEVSDESLLFLESTLNVCPDVLHMAPRIMETLLVLHGTQVLQESNKCTSFYFWPAN